MVDDASETPSNREGVLSAPAEAITNFQLLPDNGGYILVLGRRRLLDANFGQFPDMRTEISSVNFLSTSMLADMARVMSLVVSEYEKHWGHITIPGVDKVNE